LRAVYDCFGIMLLGILSTSCQSCCFDWQGYSVEFFFPYSFIHAARSLASQFIFGSDWLASQMAKVHAQNVWSNVSCLWNRIVTHAAQREKCFWHSV